MRDPVNYYEGQQPKSCADVAVDFMGPCPACSHIKAVRLCGGSFFPVTRDVYYVIPGNRELIATMRDAWDGEGRFRDDLVPRLYEGVEEHLLECKEAIELWRRERERLDKVHEEVMKKYGLKAQAVVG